VPWLAFRCLGKCVHMWTCLSRHLLCLECLGCPSASQDMIWEGLTKSLEAEMVFPDVGKLQYCSTTATFFKCHQCAADCLSQIYNWIIESTEDTVDASCIFLKEHMSDSTCFIVNIYKIQHHVVHQYSTSRKWVESKSGLKVWSHNIMPHWKQIESGGKCCMSQREWQKWKRW